MASDESGLNIESIERALEKCTTLSIREQEVFELLGFGQSNRQIAGRLKIAEGTVRVHVSSILIKLELQSRLQAGLVCQLQRWRGEAMRDTHGEAMPYGLPHSSY